MYNKNEFRKFMWLIHYCYSADLYSIKYFINLSHSLDSETEALATQAEEAANLATEVGEKIASVLTSRRYNKTSFVWILLVHINQLIFTSCEVESSSHL